MILKSVTLEGIRSYRESTQISLPTGTTLFEGDIASGKSTILFAIEFALFGLGSLKGAFLLNDQSGEGSVSLLFAVEGKEYEVHRGLQRKGRGVQQLDCYLKGPEGKEALSATELRERVLQVLKFNEPPNPRAQSVIYRYAIFTPQEEMKEVILKDADERLQTLRRAFGIEQYKTAIQNASTAASVIRGRIDFLRGATEDVEDVRSRIAKEALNVDLLTAKIKPLQAREEELASNRTKKKADLKDLEEARQRVRAAGDKVPLIKRSLDERIEQRNKLAHENLKLQKKIEEEIDPELPRLRSEKRPTGKSKDELKKGLREVRAEKEEAEKLRSRLEERIENFDSILKTNVCPVCERTVEHSDFAAKSQHLESERALQEREIETKNRAIGELEKLADALEAYESAQKELRTLSDQLQDLRERIEENEEEVGRLEQGISDLRKQLESAQAEARPIQVLAIQIGELEMEIADLEEGLKRIGNEKARVGEQLRGSTESRERLEEDLKRKEEQLRIKEQLSEHTMWITDYMTPTIMNIEKQVFTSLNQRFNEQFRKWFLVLMEDPDLQVRVDEEFTPVIEREGYDQEFFGLSGGEKTSVALAYRLALNTMVQEVAAGGGSNVLILDEPTDGFSKEQLSKVRDVLSELNCPQVILVSHERELEAFADHVFRVEKVDGTSRVSSS